MDMTFLQAFVRAKTFASPTKMQTNGMESFVRYVQEFDAQGNLVFLSANRRVLSWSEAIAKRNVLRSWMAQYGEISV
jgi:hypothetical protein